LRPDTALFLLTNLATFVTAIAALLTVREMRRQRRALYRPEFVCKTPSFKIRRAKDGHLIPFQVLPPATDGDDSPNFRSRVSLECQNIGLGPAKSVTHSWAYDALSMVDMLANRGVDMSDIFIERDLLRIGGGTPTEGELFESSGSAPMVIHSLVGQKSGFQSVVLPGNSLSIPIPSAYLDLFALSLVTQDANEHLATARMGVLSLELSYQDIESKSDLRRFTLTPEFAMMSFRPIDDRSNQLYEGEGHFHVQEI
jgi:hypothetical protein